MTLKHQLAAAAITTLLASPVLPAFAADPLMLRLEPHCADTHRSQCGTFDAANADHLRTGKLNAGDILDLDVVLVHGHGQSVQTIHSWLKYNPQILEARSVELTSALPEPIPGQQDIDSDGGYIKIGGKAARNITSDRIALARVTFRVLGSASDTEISFDDFRQDGSGNTSVMGGGEGSHGLPAPPCLGNTLCRDESAGRPLLLAHPSSLSVTLAENEASHGAAYAADAEAAGSRSSTSMQSNGFTPVTTSSFQQLSQSSVQSSAMQNSVSSASSAPAGSSSFSLLQVQNVRVTSRETSIFLGWQELKSSELKGYNIYYGTVSGKYIQRRTIAPTAASLVLRDLTEGTTYYLAVRGFNQADQESVFSQEVSVEVGKPESSSAPLTAGSITGPLPDGNPVVKHGGKVVNGTTGIGDDMLYLAVFCALIGTAFAAHRQLSLSRKNA